MVLRICRRWPNLLISVATELDSCSHIARVCDSQLLKDKRTKSHLQLQQCDKWCSDYNYKSVTMQQANTLDNQVSRIISSQTSGQLASQLKQLHSFQSKVEQELLVKTAQIAKLQNYLRQEINNIQKIVEENNILKKEVQQAKKNLEIARYQSAQSKEEAKNLAKYNDQYQQTIYNLTVRVQELQNQNTNIVKKQTEQKSVQACEQFPQKEKMLQNIGSLQEIIMKYRFQKEQLQKKILSYQMGFQNEEQYQQDNDTSISANKMTSSAVLQLLTENALKEAKFRGQIIDGLKQGYGVCEYQEDIIFEGQFRAGKRQGTGCLLYAGEVIYKGEWKDNLMEGKGWICMLEGEFETYQGQFHQGRIQGYGCMRLRSGKRVTALWKNGKVIGNCFQMMGKTKKYRQPQLIECY